MAFKKRGFKKSGKGGNDKYLRLTGLWPSKNNEDLYTGRVKAEEVEALIEKFTEALESDAPIVFSLWVNEQESRKDPEFTLQCFVGDSEESPRSSRGKKSYGSKRKSRDEEEGNDDDGQDDQGEDDQQEEADDDQQEEKPRKRTGSSKTKTSKRSSSW